jgi:broad specificity phosphatase PhoE
MGIYVFVIGAIVLSVVALVNNARQKRHAQKSAASAPRKPKKAKQKAAAPAAQSVASLAETMAAQDAAVVPQAPREHFPENLSYLSPLKRAVIMAEILGKPRGLE